MATNQKNHAILYLYLVRRYIRYLFCFRYDTVSAFKMTHIEAQSCLVALTLYPIVEVRVRGEPEPVSLSDRRAVIFGSVATFLVGKIILQN